MGEKVRGRLAPGEGIPAIASWRDMILLDSGFFHTCKGLG
jgi:hypothetical protein